MNRRGFLGRLAALAGVAAVAPVKLLDNPWRYEYRVPQTNLNIWLVSWSGDEPYGIFPRGVDKTHSVG